MMRKIFFLLLLLPAFQLHAQDTLTLKKCLEIALKNNLTLKNAELDERLASYGLATAVSAVLPNANITARDRFSYGRDINPNTNEFTNTKFKSSQGYLNVDMNLFSGFANISAYKIAKKEVEISKAAIQTTINDYTIDISLKFTTILFFEEIVRANKEQLEGTQSQLDLTQLKFDEGVIPESEVFKIKSQKATQELTLASNENLLEITYVELKQLMNLPLERQIVLVKPDERLVSAQSLDNEYDLVNQAVSIHPSYKMATLVERQSKFAIGLARSYFFPTLNAVYKIGSEYSDVDDLRFDYQIKDKYAYSFTFNVTVPIFNQFRNIYRMKSNKVLYRQSKVNTQVERNRLSMVVMQAIIDTKTAVKKYDSSLSAFEFSKKSYEADSLKFELGKIDVNELNITKNNYIAAQADVIRSRYELQFNNALIRFYLGEPFEL
jgi:outer membrane protein